MEDYEIIRSSDQTSMVSTEKDESSLNEKTFKHSSVYSIDTTYCSVVLATVIQTWHHEFLQDLKSEFLSFAPFCLPRVQTFLIQFALQPDSCLNQCFWQKVGLFLYLLIKFQFLPLTYRVRFHGKKRLWQLWKHFYSVFSDDRWNERKWLVCFYGHLTPRQKYWKVVLWTTVCSHYCKEAALASAVYFVVISTGSVCTPNTNQWRQMRHCIRGQVFIFIRFTYKTKVLQRLQMFEYK